MKVNPVQGVITIRMIVWFAAVLIAPFVMQYLAKQKEIQGETDYFKSLVLSLILFFIAFTPFFLSRTFIIFFRKHFFAASMIWLIAGTFFDSYIAKVYLKIDYLKSLVLWLLTLIVSSTAGFVLTSFSLFLLRTLK